MILSSKTYRREGRSLRDVYFYKAVTDSIVSENVQRLIVQSQVYLDLEKLYTGGDQLS